MSEQVCKNCKFWNGCDDETEVNQCRINPPVLFGLMYKWDEVEDENACDDAVWPWTAPDDWCGKFEAKPVKREKR